MASSVVHQRPSQRLQCKALLFSLGLKFRYSEPSWPVPAQLPWCSLSLAFSRACVAECVLVVSLEIIPSLNNTSNLDLHHLAEASRIAIQVERTLAGAGEARERVW